ncbi:MAG: hypothetical protein HYX69_09535 [Planctomycetia bacterium]|nr:hypothetical protein [Planctomycetia bacterium]
MATASGTPEARQSPAAKRTDDLVARYGRYIDGQLRKTRRHVRAVDVASAVLVMVIGALLYLLAAALVDHWIIAGGLGFTGRTVALVVLLAAGIAWAALVLAPLLIWRINPVYAAQTIERSRPSLKNSLVNFLLLRSQPETIPPNVFEALEQQAATGLSQVTVEQTIDRSKLVKLGWVLLAVVAVCAVYKAASRKDPFQSFRRVIAPWANIAPPTRVLIANVQPGDAQVFHDQFVSITAEVTGAGPDEPVALYYSTADGQMVDRAVAMLVPPGDYRYAVELPPHAGGLQQDITYHLAAGDAVSERYHIRVLTTPSIVVDRVTYEFPAYTEMSPRTIERQGDLSAIEGTRITVYATANNEIRAAYLDFDCDGRRDIPMLVEGREAKVTFPLTLKKGTDEPEHASYQLRFINGDGEENPKPVRYKIEVTPDRPPQIRFTEPDVPEGSELPVKPGDVVKMGLAASDADFKLGGVKLVAQRNGLPLLDRALLAAPQSGEYAGSFLFDTKSLKLAEGDQIQYWAEAVDDRQPEPNHASTPKYRLRITSKTNDQQQQPDAKNNQGDKQNDPNRRGDPRGHQKGDRKDDQKGNKDDRPQDADQQQGGDKTQQQRGDAKNRDQKQPQGNDKNDRQEPQDDAKPGDEKSNDQGEQGRPGRSGRRGDQKSGERDSESTQSDSPQDRQSEPEEQKRVDPDADPGKAFDKIIKHREQEQGDQGENEQSQEKQSRQERQPNQGDKRQNDQTQDEPSNDQQKESADGEKKQDRADSDEKSQAKSGDKDSDAGNNRAGQENRDDAEKRGGNEKQGHGEKRSDSQKKDAQGRGGQDRDSSSGDKQDRADGGQKSSDEKRDAQQPNKSDAAGDRGRQGEQRPEKNQSGAKEKENGARENQDQRPGVKKPGKENRGDERQPDDKNASDNQAQEKPDKSPADQKQGEPQKSDKGKDGKAQGEKGQGDKGQGEEAQGEKTGDPSQKQPGKQPSGQKRDGSQTAQPQGDQQPSDEKPSGDKKTGEKPSGDKPGEDQEGAANQENRGSKSGAASNKERSGKPGADAQESTGGAPRDKEQRQKPAPSDKGQKGAGDQAKTTDKQPSDQEPQPNEPGRGKPQDRKGEGGKGRGAEDRQKPEQADDAPMPPKGGNDQSPNQGDPGAGKSGGNKNGSPAPQEDNAPREKKQSAPGEKGNPDDDQPESPSQSKHQSDSKGESGDRSGGGGKGGGQRSNSPGTGSAGQNTAADEGSGKAEQQGKGESTDRAGNQQRGRGESGGAADEQGAGNREAPGDRQQGPSKSPTDKEQPQKSGGAGEKQDGGQSPSEKPDDIDTSSKSSGRGRGDPAGNRPGAPTGGGGLPSEHDEFPDAAKPPEKEHVEDEANLEYTRKATDLAIEYLKDQLAKDKPDQKLLDELKWSREDMEHFVRQWERFKQQAKATDPDARQKLDEKLESLGLRPRGTALKGGQTQEGQSPTVRGGRRSEPPPDYAEQYREFTKGRAKSQGNK